MTKNRSRNRLGKSGSDDDNNKEEEEEEDDDGMLVDDNLCLSDLLRGEKVTTS